MHNWNYFGAQLPAVDENLPFMNRLELLKPVTLSQQGSTEASLSNKIFFACLSTSSSFLLLVSLINAEVTHVPQISLLYILHKEGLVPAHV